MEQPETKTAIITGASRGIGKAIAQLFAKQGINLILGYHRHGDDAQHLLDSIVRVGGNGIAVCGDMGDTETPKRLVQEALANFGRADILVNNAAVCIEDVTALIEDASIEAMIQTNILGVVRTSREVLKPMIKNRFGRIINISSVLATRGGRGNAVYSGTKGFVESFTRSLAMEIGAKGITVNAIAPGIIDTDMSKGVRGFAPEHIKQNIPLKRIGSPEEVAQTVLFVASDSASYINGAVIPVTGGYC